MNNGVYAAGAQLILEQLIIVNTHTRFSYICHGFPVDLRQRLDHEIAELVRIRAASDYKARLLPSLEVRSGRDTHRWSSWPGAYCMLCGAEDVLEQQMNCDVWGTWMWEHFWSQTPCPHVPYGVDPYTVGDVQ